MWLCWVFLLHPGSLVAAVGPLSRWAARAPHCRASCLGRARVPGSLPHCVWDLPGPGLRSECPALQAVFLTTVLPGKSFHWQFKSPTTGEKRLFNPRTLIIHLFILHFMGSGRNLKTLITALLSLSVCGSECALLRMGSMPRPPAPLAEPGSSPLTGPSLTDCAGVSHGPSAPTRSFWPPQRVQHS